MGRRMHLWRYGQFGAPLLVFPSAAGFAHEWQAHGMIEALADLVNGGKLKIYCTETNVAEAWTRKENSPSWRIQRHLAFEHYVLNELVAFIRQDCHSMNIPIATTGTSLGAWYAANFALKQLETFQYALGMSGRYDISDLLNLLSTGNEVHHTISHLSPQVKFAKITICEKTYGMSSVRIKVGRKFGSESVTVSSFVDLFKGPSAIR